MEETKEHNIKRLMLNLDIIDYTMIGAAIVATSLLLLGVEGEVAFKYGLLVTYLVVFPISIVLDFVISTVI